MPYFDRRFFVSPLEYGLLHNPGYRSYDTRLSYQRFPTFLLYSGRETLFFDKNSMNIQIVEPKAKCFSLESDPLVRPRVWSGFGEREKRWGWEKSKAMSFLRRRKSGTH
jgi:hypothetical protein